jgi:alpha-1,2-glucosyltransferase
MFNTKLYTLLTGITTDYLLTALSLVIVTLANFRRSLPIILPYLTLLILFTTFIFYNGSVVLGDKSNHTATLHFPQLLYLWPYILFFSWPLLLSSLIQGHTQVFKSWSDLTRRIFVLGTLTNIAMVVIHFNTIVHPFTLADNRHYVFYVFRLLLKREEIKYLAAPVYIVCGYAMLQMLGAKPAAVVVLNKKGKPIPTLPTGNSSSFVLVWLITTALSLITAPLVEPRYCIIPWIMWRLRIPVPAAEQSQVVKGETREKDNQRDQNWALSGTLLETAWFIAIAVGTGYMFLYRGFSWPQEPGKTQRFMW